MLRIPMVASLVILLFCSPASAQTHELTIEGTRFLLNGKPFPYTGISFFNAIYNPAFNTKSEDRKAWLAKFQRYGINMLRVWAQWDNKRGFVDTCPTCSLYQKDGSLRAENLTHLKSITKDADELGIVIELVLLAPYEPARLDSVATDKALSALTKELLPYRNIVFQIWNEFSDNVIHHVRTIKSIDQTRLVTNSPGGEGVLGDYQQNKILDFLSPHTSRQRVTKHWEVGSIEIEYLLKKHQKPVVDDEPTRNGRSDFGGPKSPTLPFDQIIQIAQVWQKGGYIVYHHDMFQSAYGSPSIPPSGIPDPEFSPYHRAVLEFIAHRERYMREEQDKE